MACSSCKDKREKAKKKETTKPQKLIKIKFN